MCVSNIVCVWLCLWHARLLWRVPFGCSAAAATRLPLALDPLESTVGISLLSVICLRLHGSHCVSLSVCVCVRVCVCVADCPRLALVIVPRSYV